MSSTLPVLNYTTPEEFVEYYYEKLKTDLNIYDLQISKVGFVGFLLNLLGYTHFDLKQYYDTLFNEAFIGTSQTEESQYLHASIYGYIPLFANPANVVGTIEFDMINWLSTRSSDVVKREVIVGYNSSLGTYSFQKSTFSFQNYPFTINTIYKFIEIERDGSYYYYTDILTSDGTKYNIPSSSSLISVPLYSTIQQEEQEIIYEIPTYNYGTYQIYSFDISSESYLAGLEVYITENESTPEQQFEVKYTKYLEKGLDLSVFLRKITSSSYIIEFGSGIRGKWISGASARIVIKTTKGAAGNLIDKTNSKIQIAGEILVFDYKYSSTGELTATGLSPEVLQQPLINFEYSESGTDSLSGEDLRDAIINYIQTRDNMISQQDFYNIALSYFDDFKFLFKKINIYDNIFYLCRSFRDRNQVTIRATNYTEEVMDLEGPNIVGYTITAAVSTTGSGTLISGTYYYFIVGIDVWGRTLPSTGVSATVNTDVGDDSVTITWDHIPYATSYRIYGRTAVQDQYWEILVTPPAAAIYSYIDDGTAGTTIVDLPLTYELTNIIYYPSFTISGIEFTSPFVFMGNNRMNYYDGYIINSLLRVDFSEITPNSEIIGSGFEIPAVYLNLEYDDSTYTTTVTLKSYQTISNLVFTLSIISENVNFSNRRIECFPLSTNEFVYEYTNDDTFGIFSKELQIEVVGGVSNCVVTNNYENFTIGVAPANVLQLKYNDSSVGYTDAFVSVTLTAGSRTAAQIVSEINTAIGTTIASTYTDDDGNVRVKLTPLSGELAYNLFISSSSTCLAALGLTGDTDNPAIFNGPISSIKFYCKTGKFYQLTDISDQLRLLRYISNGVAYIVFIPVIEYDTYNLDCEYYINKIKTFISNSNFNANRMITDNVQCRFLNSYIVDSPFIESIFTQSGQIFSNSDYNWLSPVISTLDAPSSGTLDGSQYRVSTTPTGGSVFAGHANAIATYTASTATWSFYVPNTDDFVLDTEINTYYRWSGAAWVSIPSIVFPLNMRIEIKADKGYIQRNNVDIVTEKENLEVLIAEYLQKNFSGASVIFYNSLIIEFIHTGRNYIKSVSVFVTDSATTPNELNNGIEIRKNDDIIQDLYNKIDIVKFVPPMIYWNVDDLDIEMMID
ncbi:MAG: hypothetical protein WC188_03010 [Candidatus Caldatribacteriota bacterium]